MHTKHVITAGKKLGEAKKALIMLHGRGGSAHDMLDLAVHLHVESFALIAPQATNFTWYPYSFLAIPQQNEPWLSSAMQILDEVVYDITKAGIDFQNIFFAGFSQGACLTLEYVARHAKRWGGVAAFTGGLIGDKIYIKNYKGDFDNTPVFIGSSDPDPHIPVGRVHETALILENMNAAVTEKIYPDLGHAISQEEFKTANELIF